MEVWLQSVAAIVAITNPVGAVPLFLSLTDSMDEKQRRSASIKATLAVFLILSICAFLGGQILGLLGISMQAFRAGGGLVILLMGLEMLRGTKTKVQGEAVVEPEDELVVPFAMPLVAGPGAITTVMTLAAGDKLAPWSLVVSIAVSCALLLATLMGSGWIGAHVSPRVHRIFLRFMGLILLALGAQFVLAGIQQFFGLSTLAQSVACP